MALGGVPHYLSQVRAGESAAQNIDRLCFAREGLLRTEFTNLYASLFDQAQRDGAQIDLVIDRAGAHRHHGRALLSAAYLAVSPAALCASRAFDRSGIALFAP